MKSFIKWTQVFYTFNDSVCKDISMKILVWNHFELHYCRIKYLIQCNKIFRSQHLLKQISAILTFFLLLTNPIQPRFSAILGNSRWRHLAYDSRNFLETFKNFDLNLPLYDGVTERNRMVQVCSITFDCSSYSLFARHFKKFTYLPQ